MKALNEISGAEMGTQVNFCHALDKSQFEPIHMRYNGSWMKPGGGGLWTSNWDEETGGGWIQWCLMEGFEVPKSRLWKDIWLLDPIADAKLLVIDTYDDLEAVIERWPLDSISGLDCWPDWLKIADIYDGFYVTEKGQWETRLTYPYNLYGWDCESTCWFKWSFRSVERIEPMKFEEKLLID